MANHASALKRHRQGKKREFRNLAVKSALRTAVNKAKDAVAGGLLDEAKALVKSAVSLLDRAAVKKILHRNNASRRISRLTRAVNAVKAK